MSLLLNGILFLVRHGSNPIRIVNVVASYSSQFISIHLSTHKKNQNGRNECERRDDNLEFSIICVVVFVNFLCKVKKQEVYINGKWFAVYGVI